MNEQQPAPTTPRHVDTLREGLADYAHIAWSGWMEYLFSKCQLQADGAMMIPAWAVERWQRQLAMPYAELSEAEKNSDRVEADRMLEIVLGKQAYRALRTGGAGRCVTFAGLNWPCRWRWKGTSMQISQLVSRPPAPKYKRGDVVTARLSDDHIRPVEIRDRALYPAGWRYTVDTGEVFCVWIYECDLGVNNHAG